MEKTLSSTIENFGGRVASIWRNLHPATRGLMERALGTSGNASSPTTRQTFPYDLRAEQELSRLLAALDDRAAEASGGLTLEQQTELDRMAATCVAVLQHEAQSAEVFALLLERAFKMRDYKRVDELSDELTVRLAPSELCELARNLFPPVRAIAFEAMAQASTPVLVELLNDPVDSDVARIVLQIQADEYGSEEARWIIGTLEQMTIDEDDL